MPKRKPKPTTKQPKAKPDLIAYDKYPQMKRPTFVQRDRFTGLNKPVFI